MEPVTGEAICVSATAKRNTRVRETDARAALRIENSCEEAGAEGCRSGFDA
jgi:hypothetical protein